jgi:hypothetical protein
MQKRRRGEEGKNYGRNTRKKKTKIENTRGMKGKK